MRCYRLLLALLEVSCWCHRFAAASAPMPRHCRHCLPAALLCTARTQRHPACCCRNVYMAEGLTGLQVRDTQQRLSCTCILDSKFCCSPCLLAALLMIAVLSFDAVLCCHGAVLCCAVASPPALPPSPPPHTHPKLPCCLAAQLDLKGSLAFKHWYVILNGTSKLDFTSQSSIP